MLTAALPTLRAPTEWRSIRRVAWWLALALLWVAPPAAAQPVILTLLDGSAVVVDGAERFTAVSGQRPGPASLIETSATTAILRLEWRDRTTVDLGPDTRAMILPPGFPARGGRAPLLYVLQGWAKVGAPGAEPAGGVLTSSIEIMPFVGAAVVFVDRRECFAFAESGALEALERHPTGTPHRVPTGALYVGARGVLPRPTADWLVRVPRTFRDPLPLRAAAFRDRTVNPPVLAPPTFATLSHWLTAEPALRRDFPHRFAVLLKDPPSRQALEAKVSSLPEWGPSLNPPR